MTRHHNGGLNNVRTKRGNSFDDSNRDSNDASEDINDTEGSDSEDRSDAVQHSQCSRRSTRGKGKPRKKYVEDDSE